MTPETILDLAKAQGYALTPARARELADAINPTIEAVAKLPLPFEAEPASFALMLETLAAKGGVR
jgi:hypothetical protein